MCWSHFQPLLALGSPTFTHCSWLSSNSLETLQNIHRVLCGSRLGRRLDMVRVLISFKCWNMVLSPEIITSSQAFQSTAPVCASRALTAAGLGTDCTDIYFFQGNKELPDPLEYPCCLPARGGSRTWIGLTFACSFLESLQTT